MGDLEVRKGPPPKDRCAEPLATQTLLKALGLSVKEAAAMAGVSERDLAMVLAGGARFYCGPCKYDVNVGHPAWAMFAERVTAASGVALCGESEPREATPAG